jgi:hypothetical protein
MATDKKRKYLYWLFKVGGVLISCIFPIWAVCEKFPLWTASYGTGRSVGVGAILILIVLTVIFRKAVFKYLSDKLKLNHAPPITIWLILLILSYILIFIGNFLRDLTTVLWMGALGCAMGTVLTFVGENFFGNKENSDDGIRS